ncbi:MAG: hypothetical protein ABJG15_07860 [Hyphomonadaceae bacterium]
MYNVPENLVELVEAAYVEEKSGDMTQAEKLYRSALALKHPYATYTYFLFLVSLGREEDAEPYFDEALQDKFPAALVRQGFRLARKNSELERSSEFYTDLQSVANSGHLVAKQILLENEVRFGAFRRIPIVMLKFISLRLQQMLRTNFGRKVIVEAWF